MVHHAIQQKPRGTTMSLIDRAKNILLTPKTEWPVIAGESATTGGLFTSYAVILALLPLVGSLLGGLMFGSMLAGLGGGGVGMGIILVPAILTYIVGLGVLYLMHIIADGLAPSFSGTKDKMQALKWVVYSATPIWVAGLLGFIPGLNIIAMLLGFGYAAYLMYLGAPHMMKVPEDKSVGYTAVVILIWIVISWIISAVIIGAVVASMFGGLMTMAAASAH
jgi:Yip1 domain